MYDLVIVQKAYTIRVLESPLFDKLLIMLSNFHTELAFYGVVGTLVNESGIEFILTEPEILVEGSIMGFIKGKFYNRCTRIHWLLANVLEQKLYERLLQDSPHKEHDSFQEHMNTVLLDLCQAEAHFLIQQSACILRCMRHSSTQLSMETFIFLINRLHRELQKCIKTNDVNGYISVFSAILDVFFLFFSYVGLTMSRGEHFSSESWYLLIHSCVKFLRKGHFNLTH